jgi:hypothetical protein
MFNSKADQDKCLKEGSFSDEEVTIEREITAA